MWKVIIDTRKCIGCGACVTQCASNFRMVDGKAKPKKKIVVNAGCSKNAAEICPVDVIKVRKV